MKALNSALEHEGAADRFEVVDESGKTAAQLCSYLDAGMPVVFWATLDFQPVPEKRDHWLLADGTDFAWKCNEHCLLLVGYDEENYWFSITFLFYFVQCFLKDVPSKLNNHCSHFVIDLRIQANCGQALDLLVHTC